MPQSDLLTITQAADEMGCRPRDISDAAYRREIDRSLFLAIGPRRVIPRKHLAKIRQVLAEKGKLKAKVAT